MIRQLRGEQPLAPIDEALSAMANFRHVLVTHGNPENIEDGGQEWRRPAPPRFRFGGARQRASGAPQGGLGYAGRSATRLL